MKTELPYRHEFKYRCTAAQLQVLKGRLDAVMALDSHAGAAGYTIRSMYFDNYENQYYYENAQYDKMIQDINAKTSLIQQEDLQLELRLKQLDTEQNALSTEIDAVSKVVKDNIEKSFKTFGG